MQVSDDKKFKTFAVEKNLTIFFSLRLPTITVNNLYINSLEITKKEDIDFLKMNYTEFYGDNGTQWSWYNVPQHIREEFWPNKPNLPVMGLDPNAPRTKP